MGGDPRPLEDAHGLTSTEWAPMWTSDSTTTGSFLASTTTWGSRVAEAAIR